MESLTVLQSSVELTPAESQIVADLVGAQNQLAEVIPDDIDGEKLWRWLGACCKSIAMYRRSMSSLKVIVGRMLVVLKDRPEKYRELGYETFNQFMTVGMPTLFGIPRSEAFASIALVEKWPSLTPEQVKKVSYTKLSLISKFTNEASADANVWLQTAQENSLDKLKDICANSGVLPREESDIVEISLITTKGIKDQWIEFINNPEVKATCGTDNPGEILSMAIGECMAEWMNRGVIQMSNAGGNAWSPRE